MQAYSQRHEAALTAGTLPNTRTPASDLRRDGNLIGGRFSRGPGPSPGHCRYMAAIARGRLGAHPLAGELEGAVQDLRQAMAGLGDN